MERAKRLELSTSTLFGAANEVRTRDVLLGKQVLYQLSYSRMYNTYILPIPTVIFLVSFVREHILPLFACVLQSV